MVCRLTGAEVVLQDDNSAAGMVDLRIDYADKDAGYVEVVTDIDPAYSALVDRVRRHQEVPAPALDRVWYVTLDQRARVGRLIRVLPDRLRALEEAGHLFDAIHQRPVEDHDLDVVRSLATLGVVELASSRPGSGRTGKIHLYAEGTGGAPTLDWEAFHSWLADYLADAERTDVRRKLAATRAKERHAFVGLSFSTPWAANYALGDEHQALPTRPPRLPAEITHIWAWFYPIGRCLAWFPDVGWFDTRGHWAIE